MAGESPDRAFERAVYRERNVVERLINRLKRWQRITNHFEKRAANYQVLLPLAAIVFWR